MSASIRIDGLDDVLSSLERMGEAGEREAEKAVEASLQKVRTDAIKSIQRGQKTGRTYERGGGANLSATHRASAPGQAPATDTGRLVSSIKVIRWGTSGEVGSKLQYAFWLEYGTLNMGERPWLRPALKKNEKWIRDRFQKAIDKAAEGFE